MIPVGAVDCVQVWHCVVLMQAPDWHIDAAGVEHDPPMQVDWAVIWPPEHDGPLPQVVPLFLLLGVQTAFPVEQVMAPV